MEILILISTNMMEQEASHVAGIYEKRSYELPFERIIGVKMGKKLIGMIRQCIYISFKLY